jgi:hypothetical protein
MNEMIERVAKAIFDAMDIADGLDGTVAEKYARAAIAAMKEPTKAMEAAGDDLDDWGVASDPGPGHASALAHWHVMIDEALRVS